MRQKTMPGKNDFPLLPAVLFLLALALRIFNLQRFDLQFDELFSFITVGARDLPGLAAGYMNSRPLFIYNLFMSWWQGLGQGAFFYRLPSAVFGAACVPAVYLLGREMSGRRTALIAALFTALSAFHVNFSQEISPYAAACLLMAISFYAFFRWQRTGGRRYLMLNLACNLAGLYLIYYYVMTVILQLCFYLCARKRFNQTAEIPGFQAGFTLTNRKVKYSLVRKCGVDNPAECRKNAEGIFPVSYNTGLIEKETPGFNPGSFIGGIRSCALPAVVFLLLCLPWLFLTALELGRVIVLKNAACGVYSITPYNTQVSLMSLFYSLANFSAGYYSPAPVRAGSFLLLSGLFCAGTVCFYKRDKFSGWLVPAAVFAPMLCLFLVSRFALIYTDRYLFTGMLFFYITAACGLERLFVRAKPAAAALALCLFVLQAVSLYGYYTDRWTVPFERRQGIDTRKSYKAAAAYLYSRFGENDALLHLSEISTLSFDYYKPSGGSRGRMVSLPEMIGFTEDYFFTYKTSPKVALHDIRGHAFHLVLLRGNGRQGRSGIVFPDRDYPRIWVVHAGWDGSDPGALLCMFESSAGENYALGETANFGGVRIMLYKNRACISGFTVQR